MGDKRKFEKYRKIIKKRVTPYSNGRKVEELYGTKTKKPANCWLSCTALDAVRVADV
jgi:hypothetical protein